MNTATEFLDENTLGEDTEPEIIYEKDNRRAVRRKRNAAKACRKKNIASFIYVGYPYYNNLHQYSKNKIHCSCWMCAYNCKGKPTQYPHADMKQIEQIKYSEAEYINE